MGVQNLEEVSRFGFQTDDLTSLNLGFFIYKMESITFFPQEILGQRLEKTFFPLPDWLINYFVYKTNTVRFGI